MPKIRDVLNHVWVVTTKGKRRCSRNGEHHIPPGGLCLMIRTGPGNFRHSYCPKCGLEILVTATNRLRHIEASLDQSPTSLMPTDEMASKGHKYRPMNLSVPNANPSRASDSPQALEFEDHSRN